MRYHCSTCHTRFDAATEPSECPNCHAEAGLERQTGTPLAVKLFGALLACAITAALAAGLVGRFAS
ncbi:MAG TPA: hypothetical protein VFG69_15805 [Nannocystaceae bacterium]|nr:hypothetical protein [Nannocystaceae bacterium]